MEERSLIAYEQYKDSMQRFEYFITGVIGALCAFIAQSFTPHRIGFNPSTIEFLSLIVLLLSFFFSLKRMESISNLFRLLHKKLHASECKGQLVLNIDKTPFVNAQSGEQYNSPIEVQLEIEAINKALPKISSEIDLTNSKVGRFYTYRNYSFYFGVILLIYSKILFAYYKC
ncbi:MAG: hypothetical protein C4517_12545 [Stygiobacter sp.]|nr:MAG: hypothetical protein C4517_12545 [Stygiobacter sp.]